MSLKTSRLIVVLIAFVIADPGADRARADEPPVRLTEDAAIILYRSEPGDQPGAIAARFGIPQAEVAGFLADNGIRDATRVAVGHVYRIPNPLAARATEAEARTVALEREAASAGAKVQALESELATRAARTDTLQRRLAALERIARFWPWAQVIGLLLLFGLGAAGYVAYQSVAKLSGAERYARNLSDELEERRRMGLVERQRSSRRILDLEEEIQTLRLRLDSRSAAHRRPTGTH